MQTPRDKTPEFCPKTWDPWKWDKTPIGGALPDAERFPKQWPSASESTTTYLASSARQH